MKEWSISPELLSVFSDSENTFERLMSLQGEVYRELEGRSTQRLMIASKAYFIKKHFGVGWREIFKNLFQFRLPVISAKNEYIALKKLKECAIDVPETVAYGYKGYNPAKIKSLIMTKELPKHISLEDFCKQWSKCPPSFQFKQKLIKEVARIVRAMHGQGVNHRDFYICHLLLDVSSLLSSKIKLYLIDLHRAQVRKHVPSRWLIKDLAGLYFSSKDVGLTHRDILRFIIEYSNKPLGKVLNKELTFWLKVKKRGDDLYRRQKKQVTTRHDAENTLSC